MARSFAAPDRKAQSGCGNPRRQALHRHEAIPFGNPMSSPEQKDRPPQPAERDWTRLEHYLDLTRLWRRARRRRRVQPRTEAPSSPLSMVPFLLLMAALGVLAILIILAAVPGERYPKREQPRSPEGTAPAGWIEPSGERPRPS
jgi:hypothetical protein